ncbi:hypothetical protein [Kitasatospora sp. NPDC001175]|uniref:hypothetical protein n=1 Tax=Kitasatospora sp. NPDC001175 TaxID=3157103 RepID=UPI003D04CE3E
MNRVLGDLRALAEETGQSPGLTLLTALFLAAAAAALLVHLCAAVARRGSLRAATPTSSWREAAVSCLATAAVLYAFGLLKGYRRVEDEARVCGLARYGDPAESDVLPKDSLLPLSSSCTWSDGYSIEFVPSFVNPGLALSLAGAAVAVVLAAIRHEQSRRNK